MIKGNNADSSSRQMIPLFHPTFGSRPAQIVGRDQIMSSFMAGLEEPVGSRDRCTFIIGQRGMGKTALLLEMSDLARHRNMVPALVTAYEGMNDEIIETIQRNGAEYVEKKERLFQGFEVGALGFTIGLTFNEETRENYGFRTKLTLLCDKLSLADKGILLLVDEVSNSEAMRQLGITYQHLVGENKNIAIVMAGLPQSVSSVLNDKVLTFLNRANKIRLGPISIAEIRTYYSMAFRQEGTEIREELLDLASESTEGYPYFMQLIGYYLMRLVGPDKCIHKDTVDEAVRMSRKDLEENVFQPMLSPLSKWDIRFLQAMAQDEGVSRTTEIGERIKKNNSFLQPYRARLISAGIIESPRKGELTFTIPYLADYLRTLSEEV